MVVERKASLLALVIAVILAGGGGAWFYAQGFFKGEEVAEQVEETTEKKNRAEIAADINSFVVNLADNSPGRYLRISLSLSLNQKSSREHFKGLTPRIRHELIMLLSSKTAEGLLKPEGKTELSEEIAEQINNIAGKDVVEAVYFREFLIQ